MPSSRRRRSFFYIINVMTLTSIRSRLEVVPSSFCASTQTLTITPTVHATRQLHEGSLVFSFLFDILFFDSSDQFSCIRPSLRLRLRLLSGFYFSRTTTFCLFICIFTRKEIAKKTKKNFIVTSVMQMALLVDFFLTCQTTLFLVLFFFSIKRD